MELGLGIGYTMKPYTRIGASVKGYSDTNSRVRRQAENEEGGINEDENTPKNHNILPKNPSEADIRIVGHALVDFRIINSGVSC